MDFDSTWQWVTWAVLVPLFFLCQYYLEKLGDIIFPHDIADSNRRKLYDAGTFMGSLFIFLMIWGYWLEWIYN